MIIMDAVISVIPGKKDDCKEARLNRSLAHVLRDRLLNGEGNETQRKHWISAIEHCNAFVLWTRKS